MNTIDLTPGKRPYSSDDHKKVDFTSYQSPEQAYKQLWDRFKQQRKLYHDAAALYRSIELHILVIPLLILQVCNAILPTILQNHHFEARLCTTVIAAFSAAIIGAQGKMRFKEQAEQFDNVAKTYNTVISDTYFEMTNCQIRKFSNEVSNEAKNFEEFSVFLDQIQRMIDMAKEGCPVPPLFASLRIEIKDAKREAKLQKKEVENSESAEIINLKSSFI